MIGARIGSRIGSRVGSRVGLVRGGAAAPGFTTKDAASGKYTPATDAEYVAASYAAPSNLWLLQEASGSPADSAGLATLTAASVSYQQAVVGWTRKAITWAEGGAAGLFNNSDATLPNVSTTAQLVLAYMAVRTQPPAADRCQLTLGNSGGGRVIATTGPVYKTIVGSAPTNASGASNPSTTVRPVVLKVDAANSVQTLYTDQDKIVPTFSAMTSAKGVLFGGFVELAASTALLYAVGWSGASAQMSDATVKSLLTALGWSPSWS